MIASTVRVLVVDDNDAWRRFVSATLLEQPGFRVIGEVWDGLEAVRKAQELQPDLIVLDIGLPILNGIQAARQILQHSPKSRILFVSENRSADIVEEALRTGATGYVLKSNAAIELLPAVKAIRQGKRFVGANLAGQSLMQSTDDLDESPGRTNVVPFRRPRKIRHEVEFYADDAGFVDGFARFIEGALKAGNVAIVVATELHHADLLKRLAADGLNIPAEIEQQRYIPLNVSDTLQRFMVKDSLEPVLFRKMAGDLLMQAAKGAQGEDRRVAACGEGVHTLFAAGNFDATIMLERLWNEMAEYYEIDILCAYFRSDFASAENISMLDQICAEHSAAHGR